MWWAFIKCGVIIVLGMLANTVLSSSVQAWSPNITPKFIVSQSNTVNSYPCNGEYRDISVNGQGSINACVMGGQTEVAMYFPIQGAISYAISFPFENVFYPLDVCTGYWGCSYSEATDTLTGFRWLGTSPSVGTIYSQFVKNIQKTGSGNSIRYELSQNSPVFSLVHPLGNELRVQTSSISSNGQWSIIEVRDYGFFRINNVTKETRRVIAPGLHYSNYGINPSVETAISNDGKILAIMGRYVAFQMLYIDDSCGDRLSETTQVEYFGAVTACRYIPVSGNSYKENFSYASKPRFSYNSQHLSFDAYAQGVPASRVTLFSDESGLQNVSTYLAVGDSFVSGEGELDESFYVGGASNACHVSSRSYPYLIGRQLGYSAYNAACSGATMNTARGEQYPYGQPNQLREIEQRLPQILTVGIGGNDAGLMGKLKTCLGLTTCEWVKTSESRQATVLEMKNLYPKLMTFYAELKSKTPGKIVVIGYPHIISTNSVCLADVGVLLNKDEREFINEGISYLNKIIKAAANDSTIDFIDIESVFVGSELCSLSTSPSMNGLRFGDDFPVLDALSNIKVFGTESFHPTPIGHEKIAQLINTTYSEVFSANQCISCEGNIGAPDPSLYWGDVAEQAKTQTMFSFLNKTLVKNGDTFKVSFPALSFAPFSDISIELHSEPKILGTYKASEDGSFETTVSVEDFEPGAHSVHVIGQTTTNNTTDVYDFIDVALSEVPTMVVPLGISNISSNSGVKVSSLSQTPINNDSTSFKLALKSTTPVAETAEILGASIISAPSSAPLNPLKKNIISAKISDINHTSLWTLAIILGAIAGGLFVIAFIYYVYSKKHPRKPNRWV